MDKSTQATDYDLKYKKLISDKDARFLCEQFERGEEKRMGGLHDRFSKPFGGWTNLKRSLEEIDARHNFHELEVWWCSLGINIGHEQDGKNELFERPALILRKYSRDFMLIVPLTSQNKTGEFFFSFYARGRKQVALISQQRTVSSKRLSRKMFKISDNAFNGIVEAIKRTYPTK